MKRRYIPQTVIDQCMDIYFRQSLINDYLTCPQMALYRWVLNLEESEPFFAAILGTAGHHVAYKMHENRDFNMAYVDIMAMFEEAFNEELEKLDKMPNLSKHFDSIEAQLQSNLVTYTNLLDSYMKDERNQNFHSTMHEQSFVLQVPDSENPDNPFLFVGQIDQGGYYDDGVYSCRDLKFRDAAFRPNRMQLKLSIQFTTYATAMRFGKPACPRCKPKYEPDFATGTTTLIYTGPCEDCQKLIGTPKWPNKQVDKCEYIWMFDYERYEKDQYAKTVTDKSLPKVKSAKSNRLVYQVVENPKWYDGYKKGDNKGPVFLEGTRTESECEVLFSDVLNICADIRAGRFHRKPGDVCSMWCKHREQCLGALELELEEADLAGVESYATDDF